MFEMSHMSAHGISGNVNALMAANEPASSSAYTFGATLQLIDIASETIRYVFLWRLSRRKNPKNCYTNFGDDISLPLEQADEIRQPRGSDCEPNQCLSALIVRLFTVRRRSSVIE